MRFPAELWDIESDRQVVEEFLEAFATFPIVLTDRLANTVYFNARAEVLFGERAEEIVNRLSFSLLGYGRKDQAPGGLTEALLGDAGPWRGIAEVAEVRLFIEASAMRRDGRFLCGVIRFSQREGTVQ